MLIVSMFRPSKALWDLLRYAYYHTAAAAAARVCVCVCYTLCMGFVVYVHVLKNTRKEGRWEGIMLVCVCVCVKHLWMGLLM